MKTIGISFGELWTLGKALAEENPLPPRFPHSMPNMKIFLKGKPIVSFEPAHKYYTKEELYKLYEFGDEEEIAFRKKLVDAILSSREIANRYREDFIQERIALIVEEFRSLPRHEIALMAIRNSPYCDLEEILQKNSEHDGTYVEPEQSDVADPYDYLDKARIIYVHHGNRADGDVWRLFYLSEKRFTAFYEYYDPWESPDNPHDSPFSGSMDVEGSEEYRKIYEFFHSFCVPENAIHGDIPSSDYFEAAVLSETRFDGRTEADDLLFKEMMDVKTLDYPCRWDGPEKLWDFQIHKVYFFVHAHQSLGLAQDDWGDVEPRAFKSREEAASAFMEYVDMLKENEDVVDELNYDEENRDGSEVRSGFAIFGDGSMEWFNVYECEVE